MTTYSEKSKTNLVWEQIQMLSTILIYFLRVLDLKYYLSITLMSVCNSPGLEFPIILNNFNIFYNLKFRNFIKKSPQEQHKTLVWARSILLLLLPS